MSNYFFWFYVFDRINGLLKLFTALSLFAIILYIVALSLAASENKKIYDILTKWYYKLTFCFIVLVWTFFWLIPTKTEIITYLSLKELDNYNNKNAESTLKPEKILETIDLTIKKVEEYVKDKKCKNT